MSTRPRPDSAFSSPLPKPSDSSASYKHRTLSSISNNVSRNSSLQKVWAEDYFDAEDYSGEFEGIQESITPPPAAILTTRPFPRSIPLSADEEACPARQTRTHQRSLTALLPFRAPRTRTNSTSPQRSPTKEKSREELDFIPTLTGDKDGAIRIEEKSRGGLSSWFTGTSAPLSVGIQVGELESSSPTIMSSRDESPERPAAKLKKRPPLPTLDSNISTLTKLSDPPTTISRFSFFSSPKTPVTKTIQLPQSSLDTDEFLTLDINAALFPSSPTAPDPFSPSAFKNLLMNAEGLLLRLQTAYKLRTLSLHELSAEKEAIAEELEEAETRAQSLRAQLEDMAHRVSEQDHAMSDLVTQLAVEKQARAEEKEARERSITLITANRQETERLRKRGSCCEHEHEHELEDLGILQAQAGKERRKWRHSSGSATTEESDVESRTDSIFSRSRSPTLTTSSADSMMTNGSTPELLQASFGRVVANPNRNYKCSPLNTVLKPKLVERPSTFQKLLKGISTGAEAEGEGDKEKDAVDSMFGAVSSGATGCENCRGKDSSVAWDAVGLLRAENRGLKDRVGTLEAAVDDALDLCEGLRF